MSDPLLPCGEIRLASNDPKSCVEPGDGFVCSLPARSPAEAADFLATVGSGGALGSGVRLAQLGVDMPLIREAYERELARLVAEVERRRAAGQAPRDIARWAVEERRRIANTMRQRSGTGTRVLFEVRDWAEYGPGGRSYRNVEARYVRRGYTGAALHEKLIAGATHPNTGISDTAIKGARYLRRGGRVVIVFSLATTAHAIATAPPDQLERVLAQEVGGLVGGFAGSGLAVGGCLVFGIATGGWGLLACGLVGGAAGGFAGVWAGERLYTAASPGVEAQVQATGMLDPLELQAGPPAGMCVAPLTR